MKVNIYNYISGAKHAVGIVVIIDVFRAFSTACYLIDNNVKDIILVKDVKTALLLKEDLSNAIIVGERNGIKVSGFDYGNSPTEIKYVDFSNKIVLFTTSSGTNGILNAKRADEIITGSFVNIQSVVRYIQEKNPSQVSLVCMGDNGENYNAEDELCALAIKNQLLGKGNDNKCIKHTLESAKSAKKFFDKNKKSFPIDDFYLCLEENIFDFTIQAVNESYGFIRLKKVNNSN